MDRGDIPSATMAPSAGEGLDAPLTGASRSQSPRSFHLAWAHHPKDVLEAQRLRYLVFVEEMGARLPDLDEACAVPGHEVDRFDPVCAHLLVRTGEPGFAGEVVGTCRVLTPEGAQQIGSRYTDTEFDLSPLDHRLPGVVEMGRFCLHPDWRSGAVIMAMWRELVRHMSRLELDTLIGCCSIGLGDGGETAARLWDRLSRTHLAPADRQIRPRIPLTIRRAETEDDVALPALLKGYLRCGAQLLGPPALDEAFNTADLPLMLNLKDLPARYSRRMLES